VTPPLDYDVLVIGAGPAGIAAATRVRWVKRYHVVPCKVGLIDPCSLGGLTQMGTCIMTGPGWVYSEETIRPLLTGDVERLEIPHVRERARSVVKRGGVFEVELEGGGCLRARCVVLACGMKMLDREPELWGRGVTATSMGVAWAAAKIREWVSSGAHRSIVFVGTERLANIMSLADQARRADVEVRYVVEPIAGHPIARIERPDTLHGTVVALHGDDALTGLTVEETDGGSRRELSPVDLMVIDFLSYELRPARAVACADAELDEAGFVVVDRRQRTSVDGLFAAGDVTGMPACAGTAIGEGIVAGFEAYRLVYEQKLGRPPPLFAYYGHDARLDGFEEIPAWPDALGPSLLVREDTALRVAIERAAPHEIEPLRATITTIVSAAPRVANVSSIARETALAEIDVRKSVRTLLEMKLATLTEVRP
jgi:thioredoxin reductase (NADPH)